MNNKLGFVSQKIRTLRGGQEDGKIRSLEIQSTVILERVRLFGNHLRICHGGSNTHTQKPYLKHCIEMR